MRGSVPLPAVAREEGEEEEKGQEEGQGDGDNEEGEGRIASTILVRSVFVLQFNSKRELRTM